MAGKLVKSLADQVRAATSYKDTYREAVLEVIERKSKGEEIEDARARAQGRDRRPDEGAGGQPLMPGRSGPARSASGSSTCPCGSSAPCATSTCTSASSTRKTTRRSRPTASARRRARRSPTRRSATSTTASCRHRRGAERRRPGEDAHDRHRVLRQARRDRPDLLRPPVLPRPGRRDRRHGPRLPAARRRDGADRPGRARALRAAHEGVPGRDPRARARRSRSPRMRFADEVRADRRHPRRGRAHEAQGGRGGGQADRGALRSTGTRPPTRTSTASGCRRSSARSARAARSSCPRPTRSARSRCPDLMAALEKTRWQGR